MNPSESIDFSHSFDVFFEGLFTLMAFLQPAFFLPLLLVPFVTHQRNHCRIGGVEDLHMFPPTSLIVLVLTFKALL